MHTFKDEKGQSWAVSITVQTLKTVEAVLHVKLQEADAGLFERLGSDPVFLCDLLCVLCAAQIRQTVVKEAAGDRAMTPEDFLGAMAGDSLSEAGNAFLEELTDFFPQPRRGLLKQALTKVRRLEEIKAEIVRDRLAGPEVDEAFRTRVNNAIDKGGTQPDVLTSGEPSTSSPESSALTPPA
jgi:hypothetical protein